MIFNAYAEQKDQIAGITLVSCGHIFAKKGREIKRPDGRNDWLLFYVAKESETFYLENTVPVVEYFRNKGICEKRM